MRTMQKQLFPVFMGAALLSAAGYYYWTTPPLENAVLDLDPSGSVLRNCADFAQGSQQWLAGKPGIREGSKLTMLIMGTDAVNVEPTPVFTTDIPIQDDVVIGGDPRAYKDAQEKLAGDVEHACETAKAGSRSPIYQMVRQSIALLRGPHGDGHGVVLLKSDLDDDAHPALSAVLHEAARHPDVDVPAELAGSLDNANVSIDICGTAELAPRKVGNPAASFDTRLRIWKAMFTHPGLVTVQPFCGLRHAE